MNRPASDDVDLSGMTKAELLEYAEQIGVEGVNSRSTKAQIVEAIEAKEAEG